MKISIAPGCFAEPGAALLCRRRLAGVLARYADLVCDLTVRPTGAGLCVAVELDSGVQLAVEQAEVGDPDAIVHLADRVGRAVARCVELRQNPAAAGFFDSSKISK